MRKKMVETIHPEEWFPNLEKSITDGVIPAFGTQKTAIEAAVKYGWGRKILRVDRRFERIYIVGVLDFQPRDIAGITVDTLRVPLLRWETGHDGIKYNPVVEFNKPRTN
jgi:hypothetical protein